VIPQRDADALLTGNPQFARHLVRKLIGKVRSLTEQVRDLALRDVYTRLVRFLEEQSGNPARVIPFGTELPELIDMGAEACVFGPGDIRVAHRTDSRSGSPA